VSFSCLTSSHGEYFSFKEEEEEEEEEEAVETQNAVMDTNVRMTCKTKSPTRALFTQDPR